MFDVFPLEIVENIFLYLSVTEILSVFSAFNKEYNTLSDYFWRTVCLKEDFLQAYETQAWYECFQSGVNKKLGYYIKVQDVPSENVEHVYLRLLITNDMRESLNSYNVYYLDDDSRFNLIQKFKGHIVQFKEEFIIIQDGPQAQIFVYNCVSKIYVHYITLPENIGNIFGLSSKYCGAHKPNKKYFRLYITSYKHSKKVTLPCDVKFLIDKMLHIETILITALSFTDGYKINVYDIITNTWTLDLVCFGSTGITNDPNVWISSNFISCCDVSYRLRGIYFGPFKLWDRTGKLLFQTDIEPSTKHYLRCFLKENNVILTTSDNTITVFNSLGENINKFHTSTGFLDIKLSSGHLLFILLEEKDFVEIYDWHLCCHLYSIQLNEPCCQSFFSDFFYCPISCEGNEFEVIKFL